MRGGLIAAIVVAVASVGCSSSHGPGDGEVDSGVTDSGLGPRCERAPPRPCVDITGTARVEVLEGTTELHGLAASDEGGVVLYWAPVPEGRAWFLARFDATPHFEEPVLLDPIPFSGLDGDASTTGDGYLAAWRAESLGEDGWADTEETRLARVPAEGRVERPPPRDSDDTDATGDTTQGRFALVDGSPEPIFVRGLDEGLAITGGDFDGTVVPAPRNAAHFEALALDGAAVGLAWRVRDSIHAARTAPGTDPLSREVFDIPSLHGGTPVGFAELDGDLLVAAFEPTPGALLQGRLRIARLGRALERVDLDRGFDGWGGVTPRAFELTRWDDATWIIWETADTRFGLNAVLHASPLPDEPCLASVDEPLGVLDDPTSAHQYLHVQPVGRTLWLARLSEAPPEIEVIRVDRCE